MKATRHFEIRSKQRSIETEIIDTVLTLGDTNGDRVYLDEKNARQFLKEFQFLLSTKWGK